MEKIILIDKKETEQSCKSGLISEVSFSNPAFLSGIDSMFGIDGHEKVIAIIINDEGIKVKISRIKNPNQ